MPNSTAQMDGATSTALSLSEIISHVTDALYDIGPLDLRTVDRRSLFACALVNSKWAVEAIRCLWAVCEERPSIRTLALITPQRQQYYAACIRSLTIDYHCTPFESLVPDLSYPKLEEFNLRLTTQFMPPENPSFLQFIQPRLKVIFVNNTMGYPPGLKEPARFFDALRKQCKSLESIDFDVKLMDRDRDRAAFECFLRATKSLKEIVLKKDCILSPSVLQAIALQPLLRHLEIPCTNAQITRKLGIHSPGAFSRLETLRCYRICPTGLKAILEHSKGIQVLDIKSDTQSKDWLEIIAQSRLTRLESLSLSTNRSSLCAADLLSIAHCAPNLRGFSLDPYSIGYGDSHNSVLQGFDDIFIEEFSRRIRHLETFTISARGSDLTERSLLSFGSHCPKLIDIRLEGSFDLEWILRNSGHDQWPSLENLVLANATGKNSRSIFSDEDAAYAMIKPLVKVMPKLQYLSYLSSTSSHCFTMSRRYIREDAADYNETLGFTWNQMYAHL